MGRCRFNRGYHGGDVEALREEAISAGSRNQSDFIGKMGDAHISPNHDNTLQQEANHG